MIGCEFASLFAAFGVQVVILEMLPRILPMEGQNISETLTKALRKEGVTIETGVKVEGIDKTPQRVCVKSPAEKPMKAMLL